MHDYIPSEIRARGLASRDQLRHLLVWDSSLHCVCLDSANTLLRPRYL